MALKVGMRVRVIASGTRIYSDTPDPKGAEGQIIGTDWRGSDYRVRLNIAHSARSTEPIYEWGFDAYQLAPLTDPDEWADAQIAKLKKLGPLPVKEVA